MSLTTHSLTSERAAYSGHVIEFEPEFDPERAKSLQIANDLRQAIVSGHARAMGAWARVP